MSNNIFFICVNYNNSNYTINYIDNVLSLKSLPKDAKIIVVDNNSEKEDIKKIKNHISNKPDIKLIQNNKNLGYFGGLNEGLKVIKNKNKDFVIIGNNDIKFESNFIEELLKLDIGEKLMVICPDIITKDGKHQNPHLIKKISKLERIKNEIYFKNYYITMFLRFLNKPLKMIFNKNINKNKRNYKNKTKIRMGIGACYVLTQNFFKNFELLDNEVFMWGEEAVFANQIEKVNVDVFYIPELKVFHEENASVRKIPSKERFELVKKSYKKYKKYL